MVDAVVRREDEQILQPHPLESPPHVAVDFPQGPVKALHVLGWAKTLVVSIGFTNTSPRSSSASTASGALELLRIRGAGMRVGDALAGEQTGDLLLAFPEYADYREGTPRLVPGVRGYRKPLGSHTRQRRQTAQRTPAGS